MNLLQFKDMLEELVALLTTLDKAYPNKIGEELLSWLQTLLHPWQLEELHSKIEQLKKR